MNKTLGVILFGVTILMIALVFLARDTRPATASLDEQLQGFATASITDKNLALYWLLAKYDPLFALPGADLEKMEKDLDFLDILLESVTDTYTSEENSTINRTLYPTNFLRELAALERSRTEFITAKNREAATAYHDQFMVTVTAYREALSNMTAVLDSLDDMTIGFLAGTTSAPLIADKLTRVSENAGLLTALENKRFACLTDESGKACRDLENRQTPPIIQNPPTDHQVSPEVWGNKEALDAVYAANTASSTLIVLENSLCYPQDQPVTYAYWEELNDLLPNVPFIRATPVDDLFLQDLKRSTDNAYYKSLLDAGLDYSLQPMNLYFCVDGGVEYQRLATIKEIYRLAVALPPNSSDKVPKDVSEVLREIPDPAATNNILYENAVLAYVARIDNLLNKYPETELINYSGQGTYDAWRDISLLWRAQTAGFDQLIRTANYMTETNRGVIDIIAIPMEPLYLTRSYISLLFLLGNLTITQDRISLLNQPALQDLDSFFMTSGNELFPTLADKDKLKEILIENRRKAP